MKKCNNDTKRGIEILPVTISDEMIKHLEWQEHACKLLIESTTLFAIPAKLHGRYPV